MNNDLNTFMPKSQLTSDYGVSKPVNAWPDASDQVYLRSYWIGGGRLIQQGHNTGEAEPAIYIRARSQEGVWSQWAEVPIPEPAPPATLIASPGDGDVVDPLVPISGSTLPNVEVHLFTQGGDHAQQMSNENGHFSFIGSHSLGKPGVEVTIQAKAEGTTDSPIITVTVAGTAADNGDGTETETETGGETES